MREWKSIKNYFKLKDNCLYITCQAFPGQTIILSFVYDLFFFCRNMERLLGVQLRQWVFRNEAEIKFKFFRWKISGKEPQAT